jgi:hypothetical protein
MIHPFQNAGSKKSTPAPPPPLLPPQPQPLSHNDSDVNPVPLVVTPPKVVKYAPIFTPKKVEKATASALTTRVVIKSKKATPIKQHLEFARHVFYISTSCSYCITMTSPQTEQK